MLLICKEFVKTVSLYTIAILRAISVFTGEKCLLFLASVENNMAIRKQCSQHIFELQYNYICRHHSSSTGYIFNFLYVLFMCNINDNIYLKALSKEEKTGSIATSIDRSRFKPRESERSKGNVVFVPVETFLNYGAHRVSLYHSTDSLQRPLADNHSAILIILVAY